MKRYTICVNCKIQYCKGIYSTQIELGIQHKNSRNPNMFSCT